MIFLVKGKGIFLLEKILSEIFRYLVWWEGERVLGY